MFLHNDEHALYYWTKSRKKIGQTHSEAEIKTIPPFMADERKMVFGAEACVYYLVVNTLIKGHAAAFILYFQRNTTGFLLIFSIPW